MRVLIPCLLMLSLFAVNGLSEDQIEPLQPNLRIKPAPPIVPPQPVMQTVVTVQTKPAVPGREAGETSEPASEKSLKITIQPERKSFPGNGAFSFAVVLTNDGDETIKLHRGEQLGAQGKLVIVNRKTAAQWTVELPEADEEEAGKSVEIEAGKSVTYYLVIQQAPLAIPFPRPVPLPQPVPFPRKVIPQGELKLDKQPQPEQPQKRVREGRPVILPQPGLTVFPCGTGPCRAQLFLEFTAPEKKAQGQWVGRIASSTVDFEVGPAQETPIGPPVPPINNNITKKSQAIQIAAPVAEQALENFYQPVEGLRPAHKGNWIAEPSKVGAAKKLEDGSWSVQFTHFPKTGFSYNVKVIVNANGFGAQVTEVFASYTPEP